MNVPTPRNFPTRKYTFQAKPANVPDFSREISDVLKQARFPKLTFSARSIALKWVWKHALDILSGSKNKDDVSDAVKALGGVAGIMKRHTTGDIKVVFTELDTYLDDAHAVLGEAEN